MLFPGGAGRVGLGDSQLSIAQTNFLVRSRHHLAAQGFHVVVMDAASDFLSRSEGLGNDRTSPEHMQDIAVTVAYLRGRFPGLPIWMIGTSRGTISVANAAAVLTGASAPNAIVLASPVTEPAANNPESLHDVPLTDITVPALIVVHRQDGCVVTPPEGAKAVYQTLRNRQPLTAALGFDGGYPPLDDPCEALTTHGYFGIETRVVEAIGRFLRSLLPTP
jgi:alpha-beta hydrolase superfamily lysophospholipase